MAKEKVSDSLQKLKDELLIAKSQGLKRRVKILEMCIKRLEKLKKS
jgi:hypothetical protein